MAEASRGLPPARAGSRGDEPVSILAEGPATEFIAALALRDYDRLEASLGPHVRFRALTPGGLRERENARETVALIRSWFAEADTLEVLEGSASSVAERVRLRYRFRERYADGETEIIEQNAFCNLEDGRISALDLVCSGHLSEPATSPTRTHTFDAGDLGCGSGLPQEFRKRIGAIPVGSVLEITSRDPATKEDLPSLARLLGHTVLSVKSTPEGPTTISVRRGPPPHQSERDLQLGGV